MVGVSRYKTCCQGPLILRVSGVDLTAVATGLVNSNKAYFTIAVDRLVLATRCGRRGAEAGV